MLRRLSLRDFVIVPQLDVEFGLGFTVLTGETGAGKSILIDALQLALGARSDAVVVREGEARAEVAAEFDTPAIARAWLDEAGFQPDETLLLRRTVDAQGRSRAWINGSAATLTQLRELADCLVDIHGQHAWQSLTRPAAVRALIDEAAGTDTRAAVAAHARRRQATEALSRARGQQADIDRERERLAWQVGELDRLSPADGEWAELSGEHQRLAHGQALLDAARQALELVSEADRANAETLGLRAADALNAVSQHDHRLAPVLEALNGAIAQLQDASHGLSAYLRQTEPDPARLAELDGRMSAWMGLARRWRRQPDELPALWAQWRGELQALDAASDLQALQAELDAADRAFRDEAARLSKARTRAAAPLSKAVTEAMQSLGMDGGRFEVHIAPAAEPQAHGLDDIELRVAGHAGATPRALAKVASGGELSRLALAIAVCTTAREGSAAAGTLIFDEIDAGIGGSVGDTVGALMRRLGQRHQVLAVTHLAQVAACADHHLVVAKSTQSDGRTVSSVGLAQGTGRAEEVARMLGGVKMSNTRLAHAQAMLAAGQPGAPAAVPTAAQITAPSTPRSATPGSRAARGRGIQAPEAGQVCASAASSAPAPTRRAKGRSRTASPGRKS